MIDHRPSLSRSFWFGCSTPVVEADGPEVGHDGDADAPRDGGDGVVANRSAGEQSAHGVGDGGEGLVLSELAQPGGMVAVGTKPLLRNGSRIRIIGVLLAVSTLLAAKPERDGQPDQREGEQGQDPDRGQPMRAARRWSGTRGRRRPR